MNRLSVISHMAPALAGVFSSKNPGVEPGLHSGPCNHVEYTRTIPWRVSRAGTAPAHGLRKAQLLPFGIVTQNPFGFLHNVHAAAHRGRGLGIFTELVFDDPLVD